MITHQIQALFNRFYNGLRKFDLNAIAQCYHLPCTLNTPDSMRLISTASAFENEFLGVFKQLKNEGLASFTFSNTRYSQINGNLYLAEIDWQFMDNDNVIFSEFSAFYHVQFIDEQLKIVNASSHALSNKQKLLIPFSLNGLL